MVYGWFRARWWHQTLAGRSFSASFHVDSRRFTRFMEHDVGFGMEHGQTYIFILYVYIYIYVYVLKVKHLWSNKFFLQMLMLSDVVLAIQKTFSFYNLLVSLSKPSYNKSISDILFTWLLLRRRRTFFFSTNPTRLVPGDQTKPPSFGSTRCLWQTRSLLRTRRQGFLASIMWVDVGPWVRYTLGLQYNPLYWGYFNPINGIMGPYL